MEIPSDARKGQRFPRGHSQAPGLLPWGLRVKRTGPLLLHISLLVQNFLEISSTSGCKEGKERPPGRTRAGTSALPGRAPPRGNPRALPPPLLREAGEGALQSWGICHRSPRTCELAGHGDRQARPERRAQGFHAAWGPGPPGCHVGLAEVPAATGQTTHCEVLTWFHQNST